MSADEAQNKPRVRFEQPLEIRAMTIDGTWCCEGLLIEISDGDAEIEFTDRVIDQQEFFLLMTRFGDPVFRRCTREWVSGLRMGVSFKTSRIGLRSPKEVPPEQSGT